MQRCDDGFGELATFISSIGVFVCQGAHTLCTFRKIAH
jgi:hypothetical protein